MPTPADFIARDQQRDFPADDAGRYPSDAPAGITAAAMVEILRRIGSSPEGIAQAMFDNYPELDALETGKFLYNGKFWATAERDTLVAALRQAGYPSAACVEAGTILFPFGMTVHANRTWQPTGLTVSGTLVTTIACKPGKWTANPATGSYDGAGSPTLTAGPGYALPTAPEGALLGRVGDETFLIGNKGTVPAGLRGSLSLCINDDLDGRFGVGLADNQGSLDVRIASDSR